MGTQSLKQSPQKKTLSPITASAQQVLGIIRKAKASEG